MRPVRRGPEERVAHVAARDADIARFAARFVAPLSPPGADADIGPAASKGTLTLLRLPTRRVGVTCHHVLDAVREQRRGTSTPVMVGRQPLDLRERVLAEDGRLDLAVVDLDDLDPERFTFAARAPEFFAPAIWPPPAPEPGETIGLGGFPRRHPQTALTAPQPMPLRSHVIDLGFENVVCALESDHEAGGGPAEPGAKPDLGGLSGGPAFIERGTERHWVGVMFVVAERGDYLRLRPARFLGPDGTIRRD